MERKMAQHTEWKTMEVHQHLDAFKLRVQAQPSPSVDLLTLQAVVESLQADLDTILETRGPDSDAPSAKPTENSALAALFSTTSMPPHLP